MRKVIRYSVLLLSMLLTVSFQLRIAIFNDVHLNMTKSHLEHDLGRYGEDSTMELFDLMSEDLHSKYHLQSIVKKHLRKQN